MNAIAVRSENHAREVLLQSGEVVPPPAALRCEHTQRYSPETIIRVRGATIRVRLDAEGRFGGTRATFISNSRATQRIDIL